MVTKITASSGDVFRDLGFDEAESKELRLRSDLMIRVQAVIGARALSQSEVATRLEVTQPRVSDLLRGKLHKFSLEMLTQMLSKLGAHVSVQVDDFFVGHRENLGPVWTDRVNLQGPITTVTLPQLSTVTCQAADTQLALAA